jgi:hypothetical protein
MTYLLKDLDVFFQHPDHETTVKMELLMHCWAAG